MHTKTTSRASKTGWLESKLYALIDFIMGKVETEYKEESPMRALVSAVECTHTFPSEVEYYINVTGKKSFRIVHFETAIGGDGKPVPVAIDSFAQDPKYKQCSYCDIYMTPVDYYRHIGLGNPNEILGCNDRIPAIPQCTKKPKQISLNKAVLVNGKYRELFKEAPKMTSFRPEDAEDQIAYPEDLENPDLKDKPVNGLNVKIKDLQQYGWIPYPTDGHACEACQNGEAIQGVCWSYKRIPEIGYEHMDTLGRITRVIGTKERLVEVNPNTIAVKPMTEPVAMIRFVRNIQNNMVDDYFSVELNGKLRRFTLEEDYQSDFHPMGRFASGITEHRLCHNGTCVAMIDIRYSIHSSATMVRASNLNGELTEFFLPHTHEFFKYIVVEAIAKELF